MPTRSTKRGFTFFGLLSMFAILGLFGLVQQASAQTIIPGSFYHNFVSDVDNSSQYYGIYVPTNYSTFPPHPVIFIGHGFKGSATNSFTSFQQSFADANGWLLVQVHGRGNNFYDGIGEVDFFEVLADMKSRGYTLNENRLYFEGASMGATGAFRFGVRFPDIFAAVGGCDGFADYREWYEQYYSPAGSPNEVAACRVPNLLMASCVDTAERAKWQHTWLTVDEFDTGVWPANGYNFRDKLAALDSATSEPDYSYLFDSHPGGHTNGYDQPSMYNYFLSVTNNRYPSHIVVTTNRLKYGAEYWARIDRLQTVNVFGKVEAEVISNVVTVTASNVLALTLTLDTHVVNTDLPVTITINGMPAYNGAAGRITLYAQRDAAGVVTGWGSTDSEAMLLWKRAGLEGPIGDAYTSHFTVCYGTAGNAADTLANQTEAQDFCNKWQTWMGAVIVPIPETSLTAEEIAAGNVILYGTIESSTLLQDMQNQLPVQVHADSVSVGGTTCTGSNYGAYFVYPNPQNPAKYLVVSHGKIFVPQVTLDQWASVDPPAYAKDLEALPWYWPDYVVFRTDIIPRACVQAKIAYLPDAFVIADYFDVNWQLPNWQLPLVHRPDVMVRAGTNGVYTGNNIYTGSQSIMQSVATGVTATYTAAVQNDGSATDTFAVTAPASGNGMTVTYTDVGNGADLTNALTTGTTVTLAPGASWLIRMDVTLDATVANGTTRTATITSAAAAGISDAVSAIAQKYTQPLSIVSFTASPAAKAVMSNPVTLTAVTSGGVNVQYQFRVGLVGSKSTTWTTVRTWGVGSTYVWTPAAKGTYTLEMTTREGTGTPLPARTITNYLVTAKLTAVALRISPTSIRTGASVTLTATPTGGATVEYLYMWKSAASSTYTNLGSWTAATNVSVSNWTTRGTCNLMVYAREAGSTANNDVKSSAVTLTVK